MGAIVAEDEYWYYTANGGRSPRPRNWRTGGTLPVSGRYPRPGQSWQQATSAPQATRAVNVSVGAYSPPTSYYPGSDYTHVVAGPDMNGYKPDINRWYDNWLQPIKDPHPEDRRFREPFYPVGWQPEKAFTDGQNLPMYGAGRQPHMMQAFGSAQQPTQAFGLLPPFQTVGFWNRNF